MTKISQSDLSIVLRAAESNANGHEDSAEILEAVRAIRQHHCDHKFVDSNSCGKCGWVPPTQTELLIKDL